MNRLIKIDKMETIQQDIFRLRRENERAVFLAGADIYTAEINYTGRTIVNETKKPSL
ncbi:MAG: hypothetical protein LBU32_16875 [Clostridiales bacterium]|jgi:hypothetical protein|nr:hypothetical protein [Clostridiales bacterium]